MKEILQQLLDDGVIDDVLGRLKSGKEADVYLVRFRAETVAAKIYKDRQQRNFKSNAVYKEGRQIRNSRTRRAVEKGSRFGQREAEEAWKSAEADALYRLHSAGVRVPTPKIFYEGVLMMELVTDADGEPAPRLIDAPISVDVAAAIYHELRRALVGMLCCDLIHGDLSPYNVLLGAEGPVIIDFPQMMSAAHNNQSEIFFRRDFENIHRFLADIDRSLQRARGDGHEIWRAYLRRELTPDFVPSGRMRDDREERRPALPDTRMAPRDAPRSRPAQPPADTRAGGRPAPSGGGFPADRGDTRRQPPQPPQQHHRPPQQPRHPPHSSAPQPARAPSAQPPPRDTRERRPDPRPTSAQPPPRDTRERRPDPRPTSAQPPPRDTRERRPDPRPTSAQPPPRDAREGRPDSRPKNARPGGAPAPEVMYVRRGPAPSSPAPAPDHSDKPAARPRESGPGKGRTPRGGAADHD